MTTGAYLWAPEWHEHDDLHLDEYGRSSFHVHDNLHTHQHRWGDAIVYHYTINGRSDGMNIEDPLLDAIEPATIDEARLAMVHQLHEAVHGGTWARPETPKAVWEQLLSTVESQRLQLRAIRAAVKSLAEAVDEQ